MTLCARWITGEWSEVSDVQTQQTDIYNQYFIDIFSCLKFMCSVQPHAVLAKEQDLLVVAFLTKMPVTLYLNHPPSKCVLSHLVP